jgi:hypothetical protein
VEIKNGNTAGPYGIENLIEVELCSDDDFLIAKETLTRMGLANFREKKLYQTCHILHKRGKYYIVHFKELFALDGRPVDFTETDENRRSLICNILDKWGIVKLVNGNVSNIDGGDDFSDIRLNILSSKEAKDWELVPKYQIGYKK